MKSEHQTVHHNDRTFTRRWTFIWIRETLQSHWQENCRHQVFQELPVLWH